ncbi:hypothetical protein [Microcoleus sp. N9_B4]
MSCTGNVRRKKALYLQEVVAMLCDQLLKATHCAIIGSGKGQNAGD